VLTCGVFTCGTFTWGVLTCGTFTCGVFTCGVETVGVATEGVDGNPTALLAAASVPSPIAARMPAVKANRGIGRRGARGWR
jgi:hypothetical protein